MYAKYTVVLKDLMENEQTKGLLNKALSTYPIYTTSTNYDLIPTREALNKRLLNKYKYREIGFETVGCFLDELEITMCEIMPYYNERFKTVEIMAELPNPFDNVDVIEEYRETREGITTSENESDSEQTGTSESSTESHETGSGTSKENATAKTTKETLFSDTPQNDIEGLEKYLTTHTKETNNGTDTRNGETSNENNVSGSTESSSNIKDKATATGKTESSGMVQHTYTKKGNQGVNTYAHDMNEFRTSIIDVVNMIINDKRVAELFMLVY